MTNGVKLARNAKKPRLQEGGSVGHGSKESVGVRHGIGVRRKGNDDHPAAADGAAAVGLRVRYLRQNQGRGLRRFAHQIGMSPAALSMLETNQKGVSLQRLQVIARGLGVSIVDLLSPPNTTPAATEEVQVIRNCLSTLPGVSRVGGVTYQAVGLDPRRSIQPVFVSFAPGSGFTGDRIGHPGEELTFVLAGEVELHINNQVILLSQGDMAIYSSESPHAFQNASSKGPALMLGVGTPPW